MNVLQALWLRAQQEQDALAGGRLGLGEDPSGPGVGVPDVPVLGGAARLPLAGLHALGLINEGAGNTAEAAMGTLGGAIVGGQQAGYYALHPDEAPSAQDRHYIAAWDQLRHGHPIAANQEMGRADAFVNAIGTFALNPLNFAGAGEAAPLMRAATGLGESAPLAASALRAVSRGGHIVNELPVSPIKALLAAKRADQGERAAAAGTEVLRALLGREAPAADAAGAVARSLADVPVETSGGVPLAGLDLPLAPGRRNYNAVAKLAGLPPVGHVKPEASPLAPQNFSVLRAAKQGKIGPVPDYPNALNYLPPEAVTPGEEAAAKAAVYGPVDRPVGLPQTMTPDLPGYQGQTRAQALGALTSDEIDRLVNIAYPVEKAQANAILAHPDPTELADAAIARITAPDTSGRPLAARLQQLHPDLAEKIAFLPDPDEAIAATGGDLAAGGGGFGLVPARLGSTLAGAGVGTGIGGLAGGGLGLAAGHRDEQLREDVAAGAGLGALAGGSVGSASPEFARVAGQLAQASQGTMRSPTMYARAWRAGLKGQEEAAQAAGPHGLGGFVKALPAQWRSSVVLTFKQIPQDAITRWVTLWGLAKKELGVADPDIARWQETIASQRDAGAPLDTTVEQTLRALGQDTLATPAGIHEVYGTDFLSAEAARRRSPLNRGQSAAAGAIFGAFNGLRQVNPLSVAAGAVKGRYQPFINGFVQFLNGVQHDAFRYAMAEKTLQRDIPPLARALIADLQAKGVNVAPLVAKGDYFSGADVAQVAGEAVGARWATLVEETIRNGGDRVAFLAGDFRDKAMLPGEKALAAVFPFVRWPLHYGPVFAEIAANHPRLAAVAVGILANQREQAKQAGSKAYEAATTPISTEAPVLGGLARLRLGGQRGVLRAGLLGAVVPYANLAGGVDLPAEDAGPYEKATAVGDAIGFSPNPLIQAGAYVTGLDYRAPGALSRTAGLEGAAGLLPGPLGRLSMPAPGAALDAAREALTGQSGEYDPIMRRYAELVLDRTGAELAADQNEPYLAFATPEARALYERAKREVLTAGAVGNLASVASPVSLSARSAEGEAIRAAKANVPYSADLIARMSPDLALTMQAVNARYLASVPATRAYRGASASAREGLLLGDIADRSPTNYLLDPLTRRQLQEAQRREIRRTQPR